MVVSCADPGWDWLILEVLSHPVVVRILICLSSIIPVRAVNPRSNWCGRETLDVYKSASVIQLNCSSETVGMI